MTSSAAGIGRAALLVATAAPLRSSPRHATGRAVQATATRAMPAHCRSVDGPMGHTGLNRVEDVKKTLLGSAQATAFTVNGDDGEDRGRRDIEIPIGMIDQLAGPPRLAGFVDRFDAIMQDG